MELLISICTCDLVLIKSGVLAPKCPVNDPVNLLDRRVVDGDDRSRVAKKGETVSVDNVHHLKSASEDSLRCLNSLDHLVAQIVPMRRINSISGEGNFEIHETVNNFDSVDWILESFFEFSQSDLLSQSFGNL